MLKTVIVPLRGTQLTNITLQVFKPVFLLRRQKYRSLEKVFGGVKMSEKHLGFGSVIPPKVEGKLRLYSMEYCPFAHRARLVLRAKNIPHDIVNVNLMSKPDWLFKLHPEGKVPALDVGDKVIVESMDICEYLEENYPEPRLYPAEPANKEQDKVLLDTIGKLTGVFLSIVLSREMKTTSSWKDELLPHLTVLDEELTKRGTTYFGGENPGMVDYMLWPLAERAGTTTIVLGDRLPFKPEELQVIRKWRKTMKEHPVVAGIYRGPEKFYSSIQIKFGNLPPDYDDI